MTEKMSLAAVLLIIGREVWSILKDKNKDLRDNTMATLENSFRIKELSKKMDGLANLPKDMNEAFIKIRHLEEDVKEMLGKPDIEV